MVEASTSTPPTGQFDWYQATVPVQPDHLLAELAHGQPDNVVRQDGRGLNAFKYRADFTCKDTGEVFATVLHGGHNPHPNVKATGSHSGTLANWLRDRFPVHRVSRLDVALDYRGDDAFSDTVRVMGELGRKHRLKGNKILPDDPDDGSTYYLGAPSSPLRVRCYEKAKQLYKESGDTVWRNVWDWTRLELQVRPQKTFKETAATLAPDQFWGCSTWTKALVDSVAGLNVEKVDMKPTRIHDHERAMRFLVKQYGATMERQIAKLGSPEAFLADLLTRMKWRPDEELTRHSLEERRKQHSSEPTTSELRKGLGLSPRRGRNEM